MVRLRTDFLWLWSAPFLVGAALVIAGDAPAKPGSEYTARSSVRAMGTMILPRTSPAQSGVKLLEDILGRVRSVPQLAMNAKQNLHNQRQEIAQQAQQGPTNYQLAIRPNESSWRQQQQRLNAIGQNESRLADNKRAKSKTGTSRGIWEKGSSEDADFAAEPTPQRRTDVAAYGGGARSAYQPQAAANTASGIWEADAQKKSGLSPSQERLKVAAGKLYDLSKKFEAANEIAANAPSVPPFSTYYGYAGGQASSTTTVARGTSLRSAGVKKDALGKGQFFKARREFQIADDSPVVRDYRGRSVEESTAADRLQSNNNINLLPPQGNVAPGGLVPPPPSVSFQGSLRSRAPAAPASVPPGASPGIAININQLPPTRLSSFVADSGFDERTYGDEGTQGVGADREAKVAMLPPNVFTGIPLVRLGSSEAQASRALAASGGIERQRINGWTVLTFFKSHTREPALQVYMRHGQVDALRTFDASLVGPDFGVRLGDSLATVKERFGEPAFIIPEPIPGAGQNYVYPISQVAFLMARPSPNEAPQVTGLFIFNVK